MYPPRAFFDDDLDQALALADEVRFASIAVAGDELPEVVFAPFVVEREPGEQPALVAHVVRTNPLSAALAQGPRRARLVFQAADGYVSPSVYGQKRIDGRVVPTWNYVACQLAGTLERIDDARLRTVLRRQVEAFERAAGSDWSLDDAPPGFIDGLARAVFAVRFRPERGRLHKKLSQNRPADLAAIQAWFERLPQPERSMAAWMARRR